MSPRACRVSTVAVACLACILGWQYWRLLGVIVAAESVEKQCAITQDILEHQPEGFGPTDLAERLRFLNEYYLAHSNALANSRLERMVAREYRRTLTDAVAVFRSQSTNDLGINADAWVHRYTR